MKLRLLAAAAVATLVFAGCGGGDSDTDSNQALSYEAFGEAIGETCTTFDTAAEAADDFTGDPEQDTEALSAVKAATDARLEATQALDPPAELQAAYDDYVDALETGAEGLGDAQEAAEAGDGAEYQRVLEALDQEIGEKGPLAASKLGASDCLD